MEVGKKIARLVVGCALILLGCIAISAVLGLGIEAIGWAGKEVGADVAIKSGIAWMNAQPWSIAGSQWIRESGWSPGTLGYLLAMCVLALFGVFRKR